MQRATKEILYFEIGSDNEPTLFVNPGEEFVVETQINRGPWIDNHPDRRALEQKIRGGNPASGCIYVEGAMPGQVLIVHIGEIELDPVGFTQYYGNTGAMPGWMGPSGVGEQQKVVQIRDGYVIWNDSLKLPVSPMLTRFYWLKKISPMYLVKPN
jgi:amidase